MKQAGWFLLILLYAFSLTAQTGDSGPGQAKSSDEMKITLAQTFAKNTFAYLPGPYHFKATFETFTRKGEPDGAGSIEKFFASPGHLKMIRHFRDNTSTEFFNDGPPAYTDDGLQGSIMSYFVNTFLLYPLPPPMGTAHRDMEVSTRQLEGVALDCASYQFYVGAPHYPAAPKETLCITREARDLVLTQTLVFSVHYQNFVPFLGKSIPREISAYEGSVVRCRIHLQQVDQQSLDTQALTPPSNASPLQPGVEWRATTRAEDTPQRHPLPKGITLPPSGPPAASGEFLVLRSNTGTVVDVQPIYAPTPELAQAAVDALKNWTYAPLLRQGQAVGTISTLYLTFATP